MARAVHHKLSARMRLSEIYDATLGINPEEIARVRCTSCLEIVIPPILQFHLGNLVCTTCGLKLTCCPGCRRNLGEIGDLGMASLGNNLTFACKNRPAGCLMTLDHYEMEEHEKICEFIPYSCPYPIAKCPWTGQLDKVMMHVQHAHKRIPTHNGNDLVFVAANINLVGVRHWVTIQRCFGLHFMFVLKKQEKNDGSTQFLAIVQLIGSRQQAEHFSYRLEVNGNRQRFIWEAVPRSSHEGVTSAIMGCDCLVFDNSIAQNFADNGNLRINVTISFVS